MSQGVSKALIEGLAQLKTDHQSGSHELTSIALKAFRDVIAQMHEEIDRRWWETARMASWHLWKNGRESMGAATLNEFLGLLADMEDIVHEDMDSSIKWERVLALFDHHLDKRKEMPQRIKQSFADYLQSSFLHTANAKTTPSLVILTLSASSTIRDSILEAFASLPIPNLDLRILESRPLCEGVNMASSILSTFRTQFPPSSDRHLKLTMYTDASAALASKDVDFVLLGADRISDLGSVSNKTGSLPAVLSARHVCPHAKILVLSELEKVTEPGAEQDHSHEENDPKEVVSCWLDGGIKGVTVLAESTAISHQENINYAVTVKNVYFEWVPASLIDVYICENGVLDATGIQERAQQVRHQAVEYFDGL